MINSPLKELQWEMLCKNLYRLFVIMAVPKKKTSKSKRDQRRATWRKQAAKQAQKAISLGKSILTGRSTFYYPTAEEEEQEENT